MTPRTLPALRAAVARVLVARGESADSVWIDRDQWGVAIGTTVCGCAVEWIYEPAQTLRESIAAAWAAVAHEVADECDAAKASAARCRTPVTRDRAYARVRRAEAALAVVREIGGEGE